MSDFCVMFCCNDDYGGFSGRVEAVEIQDEIRLVCSKAALPVMKWCEQSRYTSVQIGRRSFPCHSRQVNVGNIFWDAASMTETQARTLVQHLLETGWTVEEHTEGGQFADLLEQQP